MFVWVPLEALWVLAGGYSGGSRNARDVELVKEYEYTYASDAMGFVAVGIKTIRIICTLPTLRSTYVALLRYIVG